MDLLKAINSILPYVGQRTVTSVDSNHPSVATAKGMIEDKRRELLNGSWWFNERIVTLNPDPTDSHIYVPTGTVAFFSNGRDMVEPRGPTMYNLTQNTDVFTDSLTGIIRDDLEFDFLPSTAQAVITWRAATNMYLAKFEGGSVPTRLDQDSFRAEAAFESEHLRKMNFNTHRLPAVRRISRILRNGD